MSNTLRLHAGTPVKIAILAMGGQGGGVLADWIVGMAEHAGWWAQTTSVPGVAQRTGATIYYVELLPESAVQAAGREPALALMPTPGDVDIVLAAELMEGGRAIQRGLVTPDRTVLISSSHRSYAVAEKAAHGNGVADPNKVIAAGKESARRFYCFDLQAISDQAGSVISAGLFGALAGAHVLPFERQAFEATIERGGLGVQASLRAFAAAYDLARTAPDMPAQLDTSRPMPQVPERAASIRMQPLLDEMKREFPAPAWPMMLAGLRRTAEFQDERYAREYMDHMRDILTLDEAFGGAALGWALTVAAARYVAVAMAYDDVIRVADLKTRASRFARVRGETQASDDQLVYATEYMHPRLEEVCGTMPAALGAALLRSDGMQRTLQRFFRKGRYIRSGTLHGFLMLYAIAGMRRFRRGTLRHKQEADSLQRWLRQIADTAHHDYALAVELVQCRRLVKGYSDTHERGNSKYQRLRLAASQLLGSKDAAAQLRIMREAALLDTQGEKLDQLIEQAGLTARL